MSESTGEYQYPMHRALPTLLLVASREQPVVGGGDLTRLPAYHCAVHILVWFLYVGHSEAEHTT